MNIATPKPRAQMMMMIIPNVLRFSTKSLTEILAVTGVLEGNEVGSMVGSIRVGVMELVGVRIVGVMVGVMVGIAEGMSNCSPT